MECDSTRDVDLHQVRKVAEVGPTAANLLLECGWVLHDIYFSSDSGDLRSVYVLVSQKEVRCPNCGAPSRLDVLDDGQRVRFICPEECPDLSPIGHSLDTAR